MHIQQTLETNSQESRPWVVKILQKKTAITQEPRATLKASRTGVAAPLSAAQGGRQSVSYIESYCLDISVICGGAVVACLHTPWLCVRPLRRVVFSLTWVLRSSQPTKWQICFVV